MKRCTGVVLAALLVLGAGVPAAEAASLSGRASTQAFFFTDEFEADRHILTQYLRVHVRGLDAADTLSLSGYGRVWGDVRQGGGLESRLYYLHLDKRELLRRTDVRLGRQFFFVGAGSAIVDGARIDTRPFGPFAVTVVGGRHVLFGLTGEDTRGGDIAAAAQVGLTNIPGGSASLSYFVSYDESELARELVGLEASKRILDYGELHTQLRFDLLSEVWNEVLVGARSGYFPKLVLNAEYFRFIPVFDASSIFVVFAVERFEEYALRAQYDLLPRVSVAGAYRHERYGGGGGDANVGEASVIVRPRDGASVLAAAIWRQGVGGDLLGFELSGDMALNRRIVLAAGGQHDVYERDLMTGSESASRVWVGGSLRLRENVSVLGRVESNFNENFDYDVKARFALNVDF
jgi:hypothetical protein